MNTTTNPQPTIAHETGSGCPACPDYQTWINHHCYACGGVFVTPIPQVVTGQENAEHAGCFG